MKSYLKCLIAIVAIFLGGEMRATQYPDSITASIITCYPGDEVYEIYGHTAIRMRCEQFDEVFNYGVFDFNSSNFVYRFVKGDAMYMVVHYPFAYFLPEYQARGSKVVEQVLNLPNDKVREMLDLLVANCMPANREYRYNYIRDNCSTRPRDIVEQVVGNSITYPVDSIPQTTFRDIMRMYGGNYPWLSMGIDLALGSELDQPTTLREKMFAPIFLKNALDQATYSDTTGNKVNLVKETIVLNPGDDAGAILPPTPWYLTPVAFAALLLLIVLAWSAWDVRRGKLCRPADTLLYLVYAMGGCVVWFLIFVSQHAATDINFVGLWLHPLYLVPAILMWVKPAQHFLSKFYKVVFLFAMHMIFLWVVVEQKGDPSFPLLMLIPMVRMATAVVIERRKKRS